MKPSYCLVLLLLFFFACKKKEIEPLKPDPEPETPELAKVITNPFSDLTRYSVKITGVIADTGRSAIIESGFVVDVTSGPTISRNLNKFESIPSKTGEMLVIIVDIPPGKDYFLRAFATNKEGTAYGEEITFSSQTEKVHLGDVNLSTQQEVNEFAKQQYNRIDGSLLITGAVSDLAPLKNLVAIDYALYVRYTKNLTSLRGLDSLEAINRRHFFHGVYIEENQQLKDLSGLEKVVGSNGSFYIRNNPELTDLTGLKNLYYSHFGEFRIENCNKLVSLNGLQKLSQLDGSIMIKDNRMLSDIRGFGGLNSITGRISILNNPSLTSLEGFESVNKTEGIEIFDNASLKSLHGLHNLDTITEVIFIGNNTLLSDLSALQKVTQTEYIRIENSPAITNLAGLKNITEVTEAIKMENTGLQNLSGLENLKTAPNIEVNFNKFLKSFAGLNGLKSLTAEGYSMSVHGNDQLTSLSGLENLTSAGGSIQISGNPMLKDFCGLKPLINSGWSGWFWTEGNAANPKKEEIPGACR